MKVVANNKMSSGEELIMDVHIIGPTVLFAIGIVVMFVSGGDKMFLVAGDALVALSGIAFMKFLK